ncbi:DUF982 domain-containing protein [Pseudonocardia broussonetiae]|uniref:DUF982 domain-containing protein n=1 Tax=Pseudonocardia broussonetiae TaxID=2736640 RepID=A0A6M6JSL0_9PSEU|nr:DUF982 domain-containing protein [Pseudonocardia broussonetiae]
MFLHVKISTCRGRSDHLERRWPVSHRAVDRGRYRRSTTPWCRAATSRRCAPVPVRRAPLRRRVRR